MTRWSKGNGEEQICTPDVLDSIAKEKRALLGDFGKLQRLSEERLQELQGGLNSRL